MLPYTVGLDDVIVAFYRCIDISLISSYSANASLKSSVF